MIGPRAYTLADRNRRPSPIGIPPFADKEDAEITAGSTEREQAHFGKFKELGQLQSLALDPKLPEGPGAALEVEIEANMQRAPTLLRAGPLRTSDEWIPSSCAAAEFSIHPKTMTRLTKRADVEVMQGDGRTPVLVRRSQMLAIAAELADSVDMAAAQTLFGLDEAGVDELGAAGLIRPLTGPASDIVRGQRRYGGAAAVGQS